jgi:hypothetical protein
MTVRIQTSRITITGGVRIFTEETPSEPGALIVEWITPAGQVVEGSNGDSVNFQFEAETVQT